MILPFSGSTGNVETRIHGEVLQNKKLVGLEVLSG